MNRKKLLENHMKNIGDIFDSYKKEMPSLDIKSVHSIWIFTLYKSSYNLIITNNMMNENLTSKELFDVILTDAGISIINYLIKQNKGE